MRRAFVYLLLAALFPLGALPLHAGEVTVFAAVSLTDALQDIGEAYEKATGDKVVFNLESSSLLARQIREGAPADLFLSADEAQMNGLDTRKLLLPGTRKSVLSSSLVVVVPVDSNLKIAVPADLAARSIRAIALAEPQSVPAGVYAKEYLRRQGLWQQVIDRVVPTENVRAALAAVASGNVDAGIVYKTDAAISKKVRVAFEVPTADAPRIAYPFAVLAKAPHFEAAKKFLAYLESAPALEVFRRYGFLILPGS
jgi:molybdate transport system substrate-binding protein